MNFDRLLLLMQGKTIFQDHARNAIEFFAQQGFPCPKAYNPADFFMNILSGQPPTVQETEEDEDEEVEEYSKSKFERLDTLESSFHEKL